jgi:site-specific recombinase XerD
MNVGFLIRITRTKKYSVYCRISFENDKGTPFSVKGITLDNKQHWINKRGEPLKILGVGAKKKMLILNELELDLHEIFERQKALGYPCTSGVITELYLGDRKPALTALSIFRSFIDYQQNRKIGKPAKAKYERSYTDFEQFCKFEKITNLAAENFNKVLAKKYFQFLIDIPNNEPTSWRKVRTVKKALNLAFEDEKIKESKVSTLSIPVKNVKKPFVFLFQDELELIENRTFEIERLENVRICFLFCCYTGFHFNQMTIFDAKKHVFKQNGKEWISTNRDKNDAYLGVPVLKKTRELLEKYNYVLPVITNGNFNSYLREIADLCGVRKHLTSKVARKTFTNMCLNVYGISKSVVARMLGHSSVTVTEKHYGDIDQTSIIRETEHLF